jgi:tetratricopeptide (TPR) repeat protein
MAASRVNVRFVVILSACLVALAGGIAAVFFVVQMRSGPHFVRKGDEAMARQDYAAADRFYERAVGKDQSKLDWIVKWRRAREQKVPETRTVYEQDYRMYVYGILRTLATLQRTNLDAHHEYLQALYEERRGASSREAWSPLVTEAETSLKFFDNAAPPPSIRRYRGLAYVAMSSGAKLTPEELKVAREDLEAALAADPMDGLVANELAILHRVLAGQAAERDRAEEQQRELAEARRIIKEAADARPGDPFLTVAQLVQDMADADAVTSRVMSAGEIMRARRQAFEGMRPRFDAVFEKLLAADPASIPVASLQRLIDVAVRVDPEHAAERLAPLVDRIIQATPGAGEPLLLKAQLIEWRSDFDGVIATLQKVIDMPQKPVSLEGIKQYNFRRSAMLMQCNAAASAALRATPDAREAAMDRARVMRKRIGDEVSEQTPELKFIDGKLKFAEGDYRAAQRMFDQYLRLDQDSLMAIEAMGYMADIGSRLDPPQPGLTREYLTRLLSRRPWSAELWNGLGALEMSLSNRTAAEAAYQRALDLDPANETARKQLAIINALGPKGGTVDDPILQVLIESDRKLMGSETELGDAAVALRILEDAAPRYNFERRIVAQIARIKAMRGDTQGALAALDQGVQKHPDDEGLKNLRASIAASGSLEAGLAMVDQSDAPELNKRLVKYTLYAGAGRSAEADAELDAAARLAPDDVRVIELLFVRALTARKLDEASRLTDRATQLDADRAEGDTFKARLLLARGDVREAAGVLERASQRGNATAEIFRYLGRLQMDAGRGPDAVRSFQRALELSPKDMVTAKLLLQAMVTLGQSTEALGVARGFEAVGRADPEFLNMWLTLEAAVGNPQAARSMREQLLAREPDNLTNKAALAELYIDQRIYDRARTLIDEIREKGQTLGSVTLDARWHAARGDIVKARQVFIDHLKFKQEKGELTTDPFMAMAQFMLSFGQTGWALEALKNAVPLQDPKTMAVDLAMGDIYLTRGRFPEAEEAFAKIIRAGVADPDLRIRKRYIESLVQQGKTAAAEAEFASLGDKALSDPELLCQRAQNARTAGDARRARELLDTAIARFPAEATPYIRRARLAMVDPAMIGDALADLSTAIRVRPDLWPARVLKAQLLRLQGRPDEAIRDLREALQANPGADQLRIALVEALIARGEEGEAAELMEQAIKSRPANAGLLVDAGDLFLKFGKHARAAGFYRRVWEQSANPGDAVRYLQALLEMTPPDTATAERFLVSNASIVSKSADLLMSRAALRMKQRRTRDAQEDALAALGQLPATASAIATWFTQVPLVFAAEPQAGRVLLDSTLKQLPSNLSPYGSYAMAAGKAEDPATRPEAAAEIEALAQQQEDPAFKLTCYRMLSELYTYLEQWDRALQACTKALELQADDVAFNNNAAYFLVEKLGRPAEAKAYLDRALEKDSSPAILDTKAGYLWATGDRQGALAILQSAIGASSRPLDKAKMMLRLAGWKLEMSDRRGAAAAADLIRELTIDNPGLDKTLKDDLEALQQKLRA